MKINKVSIKNFRSISNTSFELSGGKLAFVGGNESGKSNVLLAIYRFLSKENLLPEDQYQLSTDQTEIELSFSNFTEEEKQKIKNIVNIDTSTLTIRRFGNVYTVIFPNLPEQVIEENQPETKNEGENLNSPDTPTETSPEDVVAETNEPKKLTPEEMSSELQKMIPKVFFIKTVQGLIRGKNLPIKELFPETETEKRTLTNEELRTIGDFLALGNVDMDDITNKDTGRSFHELNRKAAIIAQKLSSSWKQERIEIRMSADETNLVIEFKDCGNVPEGDDGQDPTKWIWTYPENRSDGFRWFVTFYSSYLYGVSTADNTIFLIDEAGAALNKRAQTDLLNEFDRLSGNDKNSQILYATHSKYMVSWNFKNDVYAIVKNKGAGTEVSGKWWRKYSQNQLPPPLDELGVTWSDDLLAAENLIVEGPIDLEVIKRLNIIFQDEGIPENPLLEYKIIPGMGTSKSSMIELGKACNFHKKKSFLLFDSDTKGLEEKTKSEIEKLNTNDLNTLCGSQSIKITTIEDLLPRKKYFKYLNEAGVEVFGDSWSEIKSVVGVDLEGIINAVKKRIINSMGKSEEEVNKFLRDKKYQIAMNTLKNVAMQDFAEYQKKAIVSFYTKLNKILNAL